MTLGWTQYLVVIFGLCTVAFVAELGCEPYAGLSEEIARVASLEYQQEFGFEIGLIPLRADGEGQAWSGIARVTPGGRFDRVDIRGGDFIFTYHGAPFSALQWALHSAAAGETACLELQNVEEWRARRYSVRTSCIRPLH
jgi:hypothetical protein